MIERAKIQPYRQWRDPSQLTPYEARIWGYLQQGMSTREVAEALGGERSVESVRSTVRVVKDKLGAANLDE
jgi:DNA-binding CsgD family transcriptional regulator